MTGNIQERLLEIKVEIAEKCAIDSDFRDALLIDANGTVEEEYGLDKGALNKLDLEIVVEEPNKLVVVIPPDMSEAELSDDELDQVAGGFAFIVEAIIDVATSEVVQGTRAGRSW